jgi:hypothetical protein
MDDGDSGNCLWSLQRSIGILTSGNLAGRVDVAHPERGLWNSQVEGRGLAGSWFCVGRETEAPLEEDASSHDAPSWPLSITDAYVRGADLVAGYQPTSDWPYSPQIYWRAGLLDSVDGVVGSLSLLVSVQTHLLDTCPRIAVESQIKAEGVIHLKSNGGSRGDVTNIDREATFPATTGTDCIIRRFIDAPISYAEFMPSSDFREFRIRRDRDRGWRVQWELFAEFLEKGVIWLARLHGAFMRREHDVEIAAACCDALQRAALPLTT